MIKDIAINLLWIIPALCGMIVVYVIIRLASYSIFKSYFQAKEEHDGKKED